MKKLFAAAALAAGLVLNVAAHEAFTLLTTEKKLITEDELARLEKDRTIGVRNKTNLTFSGSSIQLLIVTGPEDDMLSYRIQGVRNPTIIIPSGATVMIWFVNRDSDMKHDVRFGHVMGEFPLAPGIAETVGSEKLDPHGDGAPMQATRMVIKSNEDGLTNTSAPYAATRRAVCGAIFSWA